MFLDNFILLIQHRYAFLSEFWHGQPPLPERCQHQELEAHVELDHGRLSLAQMQGLCVVLLEQGECLALELEVQETLGCQCDHLLFFHLLPFDLVNQLVKGPEMPLLQ